MKKGIISDGFEMQGLKKRQDLTLILFFFIIFSSVSGVYCGYASPVIDLLTMSVDGGEENMPWQCSY